MKKFISFIGCVVAFIQLTSAQTQQNTAYNEALSAFQSGHPQKCIQVLLADSTLHQDIAKDNLLAECYYTLGDYPEALRLSENLFEKSPESYDNVMRLAKINSFNGQHANAINYLNGYLLTDSINYNARLTLAETYQRAELIEDAAMQYQYLLNQSPLNQRIGHRLAQLYYKEKQYVECFDVCKPFIDTLDYPKAFIQLAALSSFEEKALKNTVTLNLRLEANGDSSFVTKKHLGITYYKLEDYQKAIEYLYAAFDLIHDDVETCYFLGCSLGEGAYPERAIAYLEMTELLLQPDDRHIEQIYAKKAYFLKNTGEYLSSIGLYKKAFQLNPKNQHYMYQIASIYDHDLKKEKEAMIYYKTFLQHLPDSLDPTKSMQAYNIQLKPIAERRVTQISESLFFKGDSLANQ